MVRREDSENIVGENTESGLWRRKGIPHKGWVCLRVYDHVEHSEGSLTHCEMCITTEIRYVHVMQHPTYPEILECGCICAGHMADDLTSARGREANVRKRTSRREHFPALQKWKVSKKGNPHIEKDGFHITVASIGGVYKLFITMPDGSRKKGKVGHPTQKDAQKAAFDALEFLKTNP